MNRNIVTSTVCVAVFGIMTLGVSAQGAYPQADKQKPAAQADKEKPAAAAEKGAKPHTMTGCLEKGADDTTFTLTNVEGTGPKTVALHADAGKKLAAHVGHKIAITGTDVDPMTMKKGTTGKAEPGAAAPGAAAPGAAAPGAATPSATEHHMNVTSMKMIAAACQ